MGFLKKIIAQKGIIPEGYNYEMTLPGEPMIYSIKYRCGNRALHGQLFRNKKFFSMIKCHFKSASTPNKPYVILVRFYCTPLRDKLATLEELKAENKPAIGTFELCEFILSFKEMLYRTLFHSYRQIVKIDAEKYYSLNPRTTFKFMSWEHYEYFRDNGTAHPKTQSKRAISEVGSLQSECKRDDPVAPVYPLKYDSNGSSYKIPARDLPFSDADTESKEIPAKKSSNRNKPRKKT